MTEWTNSASGHRDTDNLPSSYLLTVVTFWLFAQTAINVSAAMRAVLDISGSFCNVAVSITALFSGTPIATVGEALVVAASLYPGK